MLIITKENINCAIHEIKGVIGYRAWDEIKDQFGNQIKIPVYDQLYDQCHIIIHPIRIHLLHALAENKFAKST